MASSLKETLHQGIEAARQGRFPEAREYLLTVIKQEPEHIPAMLWLAFVLPTPQESIHILNQVLALEPENERAKAGLRWAEARLDTTSPSHTEAVRPVEEDRSDRQRLLDLGAQENAKKGVLAQRARRTINPFFVLLITLLGVVALGAGSLLLVPPETLAAWLPAAAPPPDIAPLAPAAQPAELLPIITFETDTVPQPVLGEQEAVPPPTLIGPEVASPTPTALPAAPPNPLLAHQPAYPGEKWIEVNVTTQQLIAWEGDVPVMTATVSTGLPNTPTILGEFNIYWKLESGPMSGADYYLPGVPYTMYFYSGYALHGTYWHSNFGQPMSHGCVNLETSQAKALYEWASPLVPEGQTQVVATADNPGTLVVIHP
jgi:lipoprotein-anchoring transpeptidase ErfK/SrfK